jgi:hypothetical protein
MCVGDLITSEPGSHASGAGGQERKGFLASPRVKGHSLLGFMKCRLVVCPYACPRQPVTGTLQFCVEVFARVLDVALRRLPAEGKRAGGQRVRFLPRSEDCNTEKASWVLL